MIDPRYYQISALTGLLVMGVFRLGFDIPFVCIASILTSVLVTQYACTRFFPVAAF